MGLARATHAAGAGYSTAGRCLSTTRDGGGKGRKNLRQVGRATVGTWSAFPMTRTDEYFVFLSTVVAMKFVDRHGGYPVER